MDPNLLRDHLKQLHADLSAANQVDPHTQQLRGEIMEDIKRLIERPPTTAAAAMGGSPSLLAVSAEETSLPDRLERIAVQFEADHPTLAASSRRLIDLLGKVGL